MQTVYVTGLRVNSGNPNLAFMTIPETQIRRSEYYGAPADTVTEEKPAADENSKKGLVS
jgi:hypothetical protein